MPTNDPLHKKIQAILKSKTITENKLRRLLPILTKENQPIIKACIEKLCQNSLSDVLQEIRDLPETQHSSLTQHTLLLGKKYISFIDNLIDDTASLFDRINHYIENDQNKLCLFETMNILDNAHLSTVSDLKKKWELIHKRTFDSNVPRQIDFHLQRHPDSLITKTACLNLCVTLALHTNTDTHNTLIGIREWTEDDTRKVGENVEKNIPGFNIGYMVNTLLRQTFNDDKTTFKLLVNSLDLLDSNWRQQNRITDDAIGQSLSNLHDLHNNQTKPKRKSNSLRNKRNQTCPCSSSKKTSHLKLPSSASLRGTQRNNRNHSHKAATSFTLFFLLSGLGYALYYLLAKQGQNQLQSTTTSPIIPPRSFSNHSLFNNWHQPSPQQKLCDGETGPVSDKINTLVTKAIKGHVESQYRIGILYEEDSINQYDEDSRYLANKAAYWYHHAATKGNHAKSQTALAKLLEQKLIDVKHDYKTARYWYEKAANQNDDEAQFQLAESHYYVTKNLKTAVFWFRRSANLGNYRAQYALGTMYERGNGIRIDYKEAEKWYRASATLGFKHAQYNLGTFYHNGMGVEINDKTAAYWFELAAKQGLEDAQNILDDYYNQGTLDKPDHKQTKSNHEQGIKPNSNKPGDLKNALSFLKAYYSKNVAETPERNQTAMNDEQETRASSLTTVYKCNLNLFQNKKLASCSTINIVDNVCDSPETHNQTRVDSNQITRSLN